MNIFEFFNPANNEHMDAYKYYLDNHTWPKGFLPEDVYFPPLWRQEISGNIADFLVSQHEGGAYA